MYYNVLFCVELDNICDVLLLLTLHNFYLFYKPHIFELHISTKFA